MKKIYFLLLLLAGTISAQDIIQTKGGTTISVVEGSIKVHPGNKMLTFQLAGSEKRSKLKYKEIVSAKYKDHQFVTAKVKGKPRGFFILADANGKMLGAIASSRVVNKGGFDVPYKRYEFAILDKSGNPTEYLVFTDVENPKNRALRKRVSEIILGNFSNCPNLLERLKTFESTSKIENGAVADMIENPYQISCQ